MPKSKKSSSATAATVGYEAQLWQMADALRGSMDAAEYKHVVLGLIFLKYISDAFEEKHAALLAEQAQGADPEDPDEYRAQSIFWVPPEARWPHLKAQARQSTIGQLVDDAMAGIERDNPALKGVLPKDYARPALDKQRLGQLIDMISNIKVGDEASRAKDVLGRVYEYFLSQFASAEGKKGGEFYTPRCSGGTLRSALATVWPSISILPASTAMKPATARSSVVLPQPELPTTQPMSPWARVRSSPSATHCALP